MFKRTFIIASLTAASFFITFTALAQEEQVSDELKIDTEISAEDLGVQKARILPDSPIYGFKNIFRGIREGLTRNPVRKAELQLKHANEKMVEARQLVEEKGTEKAQERAARVVGEVNNDFEKIVRQSGNFAAAKEKDKAEVEKFLGKIADQSFKHQIILQRLEEQVPEKVFTKIEESRQQHLEKFGQVMTKAMDKPGEMQNFLSQVIEKQEGSDFKELKAVEILRNLEDKIPEESREALRMAQTALSQKFEQRMIGLPEELRQERFQKYVEFMPGNAVRQFETFETMKQSFQSPKMVQEMELAKDRAVQKFENQFNQFQGEDARSGFMAPWRNGDPEDLRTMTEMEMRMEPIEKFQQFHEESQNNFRDRFMDNPEALQNNPVFQRMASQPDVVDLKFSQELSEIMPAAPPKTMNFIRGFRDQATQKFIENIQSSEGASFGPPIPGGLKVLEEIKDRVPLQAQKGIDQAMKVQVQTMERHIEEIRDPAMLDRYKQRVEGDRTIKNQVERFAPQNFFKQIEERGRQLQMPSIRPAPVMPQEGDQSGSEGGTLQRPYIPLTPERTQLFEGRQLQPQTQFQQQPPATEQFTAPALTPIEPIKMQEPLPQTFPSLWQKFLGSVVNFLP